MKRLALAVSLFLSSLSWAADDGAEPMQKAQASVKSWLKLLDAGNYAATWDEASTVFQQKTPKGKWTEQLAAAKNVLGGASNRELVSVKMTDSVEGAPKGRYAVLEFRTQFEKKGTVVEAVTPALGTDGKWKVAGYSLYGTK